MYIVYELTLHSITIKECVHWFQADLSCRNTKQQVGALFTRSNFVTLKYVTDNWGTDANGFRLVITAVKDPSEYSQLFDMATLSPLSSI